MDVQRLWETVISQTRREAELVCEKAVAARGGPTLTWSKCLPFAAVLIGARALQSLATAVLQASACAHFSAVVTLWTLSVSAGLIVAAGWVLARHFPVYLYTGRYGAERRTLKVSAEALCAAAPAGRLQREMESVLAYIEDLPPPDDSLTTITAFLEVTFLMAFSLFLLFAMAADIFAACAV